MKALLSKLIHILIMPCSHVPALIEQRNAGKLSFVKRVRLHMHLSVCKFCAAYARKVEQIDRLLLKNTSRLKEKEEFKDAEIQWFKERIKEKINS
ncbi:hypothetical protein [Porphyromonas macacae]|uniref:Zf-HC2 domain-containing protein n=1 Tax=Porphyromonas macacae TaxID=28115 RepID=A0A379DFP2_9PORP|nr:hypothetical protein [Porphyromonas macacae]SUB77208.1 Uncharacterised protein [Porphyromonas macacae]